MKLIKQALLALSFGLIPLSASASITSPELDKEYFILSQPQQTDSPGKIEVTEFFFYGCPHCNLLDPLITEWVKKQGSAISFKRVHVDFGQGQQSTQRLYFTLEAMGKLEQMHALIFKAIHQDRQYLRTDLDVLNFVTSNGIDRQKYLEISKSFSIEAKLRRAKAMQEAYKIDGVPTLFVDGHYMTSPSVITNAYPGMPEAEGARSDLVVLDALVAKAQKDHGLKK
jgi:thiol:disulfide interchange protein DsbA